ncbi:MAG: hypothetical protein ACRBN8_23705 [Nannocystales bacterium]
MAVLYGCLVASMVAATTPRPGLETVLREYDNRRVTVDTVFAIDDHGGREIVPKRFQTRTGDGRELVGPQFYAYVDRPDLAIAYRARSKRKKILGGVGIGLLATGAGLSLGYIAASGRTANALLGSGVVLMFGSMVPIGFATALSPHPVTPAEVGKLVNEKNRRLRAELGLPEQVRVHPIATASGGGAVVSGRF